MPSLEAPYFSKRVAVSLTLMGVVTVGVLAALSQPALSTRTAAKQTTPAPVRVVDAPRAVVDAPRAVVDAPRAKEGCAEQTWPYMEARCLTRDAKNATPLANTAPSPPASPTVPSSVPQVVPRASQTTESEPPAPVRSQPLPTDPQPIASNTANKAVVVPEAATKGVSDSSRLASTLPPPPGAEPRLPNGMPTSTPRYPDAARPAAIASTVAAGVAMTRSSAVQERRIRPRAERRRGAIRPSRSFGLFGFRIVGVRF